jgi:hypothetical protein
MYTKHGYDKQNHWQLLEKRFTSHMWTKPTSRKHQQQHKWWLMPRKEEKTWDQIVPPQYHKWKKVFSEEEVKQFLEHQPWDITIDFTDQMHQIYWIAKYTL